ncbi:TPA: response regulator [Candidatus Woesearchaeota archaeon]|nr:response regulator [Candidatus Woesearchaeota archaeon]
MSLKILVVDDDRGMIETYRSALRSHELTELGYTYEVYSVLEEPFDLAFLDFGNNDDFEAAAELKRAHQDIFTVVLTEHPDSFHEDESIDMVIDSKSPQLADDITDALHAAEQNVNIITCGGEHVDYFHPGIIRKIDLEMERSKLRPATHTNDDKWIDEFSNAVCAQLHELKRDYSPERHCIVHACMAFARVAGFDLVKNARNLFQDYQSSFPEVPDFSHIDTQETAKTLLNTNMGNNIYRFVIKFSSRLDYEIGLRLTNLSTKKLGCRVQDRAIVFACLALYWVNNQKTLLYQKEPAFMVYDRIMAEHGFAREFA